MPTRAQVLEHVLLVILELEQTSYDSVMGLKIKSVTDLTLVSEIALADLQLPYQEKANIMHLQKLAPFVEDWMALDADDFDKMRMQELRQAATVEDGRQTRQLAVAAGQARKSAIVAVDTSGNQAMTSFQGPGNASIGNSNPNNTTLLHYTPTNPTATTTTPVTSPSVNDFMRGHKRDVNMYMKFSGDKRKWFETKRNWVAVAAGDGVSDILQAELAIDEADPLVQAKSRYVCLMLQNAIKGGQALVILMRHEINHNGHKVFQELVAFYEREDNLALVRSQCLQDLVTRKLSRGTNVRIFIEQFQITMLEYERAKRIPMSDDEKISMLEAVVEDPTYFTLLTNLKLSSKATEFSAFIESIISYSDKTEIIGKADAQRQINYTNRRDGRDWKNDLTARVPQDEWEKMSQDEKKRRMNAKQQSRTAFSSSPRSHETLSQAAAISGSTTDTAAATSQRVTESTLDDTRTQGSPRTVRFQDIMNQQTRNTNAMIRINHIEAQQDGKSDLCLIDSGSNGGMAGENMRLLEETEHPISCTVLGPGDVPVPGMDELRVGTYGAVMVDDHGDKILGLFHHFAGYGKGKSILSESQALAFGTKISAHPKKYGGEQTLKTVDGTIIPLIYKEGLIYMPIQYPTDEDITTLLHVDITNPIEWTPEHESDGNDSFSPFILDISDGYEYHQLQNNFSRAIIPRDYGKLRRFFGWRPEHIVKETFENTTQFATNTLRLPLRRHFKSRYPALNVPRLKEIYATDTFYSNVPSIEGSTCTQLFVGKRSNFTWIFGMRSADQMPDALIDFIRTHGAMAGLFSDNAKVQVSAKVQEILRMYCIKSMTSEPNNQQQNKAERRIQDVKAMVNTILDRSGAPSNLWYYAMKYAVHVLNHTSHDRLNWKTPMEIAFGQTPDISSMLCFHFYQLVLYLDPRASFPDSREKAARFIGITENIGDALTFLLLAENDQVLARSVVRPALSPDDLNFRALSSLMTESTLPLVTTSGNTERNLTVESLSELQLNLNGSNTRASTVLQPDIHRLIEPTTAIVPNDGAPVYSFADRIEPEQLVLPEVDVDDIVGKIFMVKSDIDGLLHRAEVIAKVDSDDPPTQYLVRLGDGERQDVMTYISIIDALNKDIELATDPEEKVWAFKKICDHRKVRNSWQINILWEDGSNTWEPLSNIARTDPVTVAKYAKDNDLLEESGWVRFRKLAKTEKKLKRLLHHVQRFAHRKGTRFKFGVEVPRSYKHAMEIDASLNNTLWADAVQAEMDQVVTDYKTFESIGYRAPTPEGYTKIRVHLVFDIKQDGRRKARLVADGNLTDPFDENYFSSVISLRSMRLVILIACLNQLELCSGDIGNAYLTAYTREKVCFIGGPEFRAYGFEGHLILIVKALYGLKTSGSRFHESFADTLRAVGFKPTKADQDIWIRNRSDHYEYVATYVDDIIYAGKNPKAFYDTLINQFGYKLKGVGFPSYHLGGDFEKVNDQIVWGSTTYVKRMIDSYKQIFGEEPSARVHAPLEPGDQPELDTTPLCNDHDKRIYWKLIGELQWAISLGRMDIACATMTMSRFRVEPREGHLKRLKRIYGYLRNYRKTGIIFNTCEPNYRDIEWDDNTNWGHIYHPCSEDIPDDMPEPKGKSVVLSSFVDANLLHCALTGRSCTGILHMINKTPIEWFSKRQNTVESSTYGSEFTALRLAVDQIIDIRYSLRMLGVPVTAPTYVFGDNLSSIVSSNLPTGRLTRRHSILSYHRVREAVACRIIRTYHMNGIDNPADILTKHRSSKHWFSLMKPLIFWNPNVGSSSIEGSVRL